MQENNGKKNNNLTQENEICVHPIRVTFTTARVVSLWIMPCTATCSLGDVSIDYHNANTKKLPHDLLTVLLGSKTIGYHFWMASIRGMTMSKFSSNLKSCTQSQRNFIKNKK